MPLERRELEKKKSHLWKRHIDEHLKPYVCLFPECAESLTCFTRRHEWKAHMESAHSRDWLRKVHTTVWYCDIDHDSPETFETELQWRKRMQALESHPKRRLTAPTQAQLDALSPRKQQVTLRDKFVCPLCEQIPEKIQSLVEKGKGEPADMYNFVINHVADHIKSLSLMAMPSLENTTQETPGTLGESVLMLNDSFRRLVNENSIPQQPSGREYIDGTSLPPEAWSLLHRDSIVSLTMVSPNSVWDKEYFDYTPPEDPPEPSEQRWVKLWNLWKSENDPFSQHSLETDPVLVHLNEVKATGSVQLPTQAIASDELDVNSTDAGGRTRLSFAAETGDLVTAQLLLDKGAHLDIADHDGRTPLLWAADNGREATVRLLLDKCARIEAADQIYGRTPLSWAASKGHQAVVQLLLDRGADVDAADNSRRTPLSWAASRGHEATVRLLMQYGADPELSDPKYGRTPLSWAVVRGHQAVVKLLLDRGVKVDAADLEHDRTPLSWAAEYGHEAILRLLLSRGAHIEAVDRESKQTSLSFAAENGHEEIVRILLEQGADLEATDLQGWTALSWATKNGHDGVVRLLCSHDTKIPSSP
jgi:ankyrin repeat protein